VSRWSKWKRLREKWERAKERDNSSHDRTKPADNMSPPHHLPHEAPRGQPHPTEEQQRAAEQRFWDRQIRVGVWLNRITAGGAVVAICALFLVYCSVAGDEDATIQANRAWIDPTDAYAFPNAMKVGDPIPVTLLVFNPGKQPALNPKIVTEHSIIGVPEDRRAESFLPAKSLCDTRKPTRPFVAIFPTEPHSNGNQVPLNSLMDGGKTKVTHEMKEGQAVDMFRGCISYETFRETHYTWFCFLISPVTDEPLPPGHWLHMKEKTEMAAPCKDGTGAN
jgi:hypothetical protein